MVATRRSARIASQGSQNTSSPASQASPGQAAGAKRKSELGDSPSAKRGKKNQEKEQKTLEETLPTEETEQAKPQQQTEPAQKDVEMRDAPKPEAPKARTEQHPESQAKPSEKHIDQPISEQSKPEPKPVSQHKLDETFVKKSEEQPKQEQKTGKKTEQQPQEEAKHPNQTEEQPPREQPKTNDRPQPQSHSEPKQDAPRSEAPQRDEPKYEAPKPQAPQPDEPKQDTPKPAAPQHDEPKHDAPKQEAPERDEPKGEATKPEAPQQSEPKREVPKPEVPQRDEPKYEAPKYEVPQREAQNHTQTPEVQPKDNSKPEKTSTNGDNAVIPKARSEEEPSNILEKGIIYFLYRGRVGIDDPSNVGDIARSYIILRPLPPGAKLGDGPIGDDRNCRLLALPKKVLPLSGKDRWTAFVEKSNTSFKELKDSFLGPSDYQTQTAGVRHSPAAVPAAEGVYAITTTGRESHLAYMMTLPTSMGEIQNDLGLREKGSFVTSVKNPKYPGPSYADIGKDPGYSQEIIDEFRNLRWGPLQPEHLNYENCQFLLVGESGGIDKAAGPPAEGADGQQPKQELEKLEGEDEIRVKHLHGDDAVFADLGVDSKSYPGMQTTWK